MKIKMLSLLLLLIPALCAAQTVTLSWDASPTTGVEGYNLYYACMTLDSALTGTGASEGDAPIDVGDVLTYQLTLPDSYRCFFAVTAYIAPDESAFSNVVKKQPLGVTSLKVDSVNGRRVNLGGGARLSF